MKNKDPIQRNLFDVIHRLGAPPQVSDDGWETADLLNGWLGVGDDPPRYAMRYDGTVVCDGKAYYGYWGSPIFQLPVGLRPEIDIYQDVRCWSIDDPTQTTSADVAVSPNGWVYLEGPHAQGNVVLDLSELSFKGTDATSEEDDVTLDVQPHMITTSRFGWGWVEMVDFFATAILSTTPDLSVSGSVVEIPIYEAVHANAVCVLKWKDSTRTFGVKLTNVELIDGPGTMTWSELADNIWIGTAPETGIPPKYRLPPDDSPGQWFGYYAHSDGAAYNGYPAGWLLLSGSTAFWRLTFNGAPNNTSAYEIHQFRGVKEDGATGYSETGNAAVSSIPTVVAQGNSLVVSTINVSNAGFVAPGDQHYGEIFYLSNQWYGTGTDVAMANGYSDAGTVDAGWDITNNGSSRAYSIQVVVLPGQFTTPRGNTVNEYY